MVFFGQKLSKILKSVVTSFPEIYIDLVILGQCKCLFCKYAQLHSFIKFIKRKIQKHNLNLDFYQIYMKPWSDFQNVYSKCFKIAATNSEVHNLHSNCQKEHPVAKVSKTRNHHQHALGRFWITGEPFGQHFTLFCRILQFVANHALLTVHMNKQAKLYGCLERQDCNT